MQRAAYVIALSRAAAEGGRVARGESQVGFAQTLLAPPDGLSPAEQARRLLDAFLERAEWGRGITVLVLPTAEVSVRRLHFAFADPRKIRQVLPFELEQELLEGPQHYHYDFEIAPAADGTAEVMVYLVERAYLDGLVEVCDARQLTLSRVTFAAHALAGAEAPQTGLHFAAYVGSDDAFVTFCQDGRVRAVQPLGAQPGRLLERSGEAPGGGVMERLQALFGQQPGDAEGQARLERELEAARGEINRFVRVNSAGESYTLSLHGLFNRLLLWRPDTGTVALHFDRGFDWGVVRRPFAGALSELLHNPRPLLAARGLNFFRRVGTWLNRVRELRWELAAAGVLLALLAGLAGGRFYVRTATLNEELAQVNGRLRQVLDLPAPVSTVAVDAALKRLETRLEELRKEREAFAYLEDYHYNTMVLFRELSALFRQYPRLTVEALSFNRERFTISGTTENYTESQALQERLGELPQIEAGTMEITHSRSGDGIRYRIAAER